MSFLRTIQQPTDRRRQQRQHTASHTNTHQNTQHRRITVHPNTSPSPTQLKDHFIQIGTEKEKETSRQSERESREERGERETYEKRRHSARDALLCTIKTPPCVPSKRPCVMYTRERFQCTHSVVFPQHQ